MNMKMLPEDMHQDAFRISCRESRDEPLFESSALFGGSRQIAINHNGTIYRLKITRFGKLILNK